MKKIILLSIFTLLTGCASTVVTQTTAEKLSGYTYIPLDPFSVQTNPGNSCDINQREANLERVDVSQIGFGNLLESLPDNAVRMSIEKFNASGSITYGPAGVGAEGESYRVTVDYINADTTNVRLWLSKRAQNYKTKEVEYVPLSLPNNGDYTYGTKVYEVLREPPVDNAQFFEEYNLPVYVGIGLRVTSNIDVIG